MQSRGFFIRVIILKAGSYSHVVGCFFIDRKNTRTALTWLTIKFYELKQLIAVYGYPGMSFKITDPLLQVIGLGILAGMRATSAPAITSHILSHHQSKNLSNSPLGFIQSDKVAAVLKVLAIGEFVGDKLPNAADRIIIPSVITRSLSGALSGASIYKSGGKNAYTGALIGTAAAFASTFGSYFLRKVIVKKSHIADPFIGALEDSIVIGAALTLI